MPSSPKAPPAARGVLLYLFDLFMGLFIRPDDSPLQRLRKESCLVMVLVLGLIASPFKIATFDWELWTNSGVLVVGIVLIIYTLLVCARTSVSDNHLAVITVMYMAVVALSDFDRVIAAKPRTWGGFIIAFDLMLLLETSERMLYAAVAFVIVWIIMLELENQFRFGLYDLPGTRPYDQRLRTCERPPCALRSLDPSDTTIMVGGLVLCIDLCLTRRFAMQARQGEATMRASVNASIDIAKNLSRFDLEGAQEAMTTHSKLLPEEMRAAHDKILSDLRSYRAYLPMSCLVQDGSNNTDAPATSVVRMAAWETDDSCTGSSPAASFRGAAHAQEETDNTPTESPQARQAADGAHVQQDELMVLPMVPLTALSLKAWDNPLVSPRAADFRSGRVTIVVLNMRGSTARYCEDLTLFVQQHEQILSFVWATAMDAWGIVDRFLGDRFHLSFNALRKCVRHAAAAVSVAREAAQFSNGQLSCAVTSCVSLCGILGTVKMRAPAVLGHGYQLCDALLRACRTLDCRVVCTSTTRQDVWHEHELKLLIQHVEVDGATLSVPDLFIWHVVLPGELESPAAADDGKSDAEQGEWMYDVAARRTSRWEVYNQAGHLHLVGSADVALRVMQSPTVTAFMRREYQTAVAECRTLQLVL